MTRVPNPLIVAADMSEVDEAASLAKRLSGVVAMVKVGLELFTAAGPEGLRRVGEHAPLFLDLKLHDIPNTVGRAARNVGGLGARMLTVHALGGPDMVRAAVDGAEQGARAAGVETPGIIAITVLSSLAGEGLVSPASLAFEAVAAGADGVVVSGDDVQDARAALGEGPVLVVPGIRPRGFATDGHARVLTPAEAMEKGADYLVVGRPITEAADPAAAARAILREVGVEQ
ncbi:MAG TPA: orotidine-5'-phosphate decarboxylase [Actinomycetota bacterium]|nr:orotidine-5'-phosphate decarboxylase [Actinomycetota bacterium]